MQPPRWRTLNESAYPWEREALAYLQRHLPEGDPWMAWSNCEFVADDGSVNEVDLLVFSPAGAFVVEIKSRPGTLEGDQTTWRWTTPEGHVAILDSPVFLARRKAQRLASLLRRQKAYGGNARVRPPFLDALVFVSAPGLDNRLRDNARFLVCGRDRAGETEGGILAALGRRRAPGLEPEPKGEFNAPAARLFARALEQAGIRASQRARRVHDYHLERLLGDNPAAGCQDWLGTHVQFPDTHRLVRLYLVATHATAADRERVRRAARREFQLLERLSHPGILAVEGHTEHELGPALTFRYDPAAVRLDHFLTQHGRELPAGARLGLLRQIAEAIAFAHGRGVVHRALCPGSVFVCPVAGNGAAPAGIAALPRVQVYNWQAGAQVDGPEASSAAPGSTATQHVGALVEDTGTVYLAPEALTDPGSRGEGLDVFSLGALAYLLFADRPPATSLIELGHTLREHRGLSLAGVRDGIGPALQELVAFSTDPDPARRVASAREFLDLLTAVEEEMTIPAEEAVPNPHEARPNDVLAPGLILRAKLGSGSTAAAFLVEHGGRECVLKLALDPASNPRLESEFHTLKGLRHPNIAAVFEQVHLGVFGGFTMQRAGEKTLATRLREEGRLSLEYVERFGEELLEAIRCLDQEGVNHRDLKPENMGVGRVNSRGGTRLILFDFSLSDVPPDNLRAGTPGYLEPFLSQRRPPRWDLHAERYAAAITLHELATGRRPVWGDGAGDPAQTEGEITVDPESFDPAVREGLVAFFRRALARDYRQRFDHAGEMLHAWQAVFRDLDRPAPGTDDGEEVSIPAAAARASGPEAPIGGLGLTPRLLVAIERLGASTVAGLLAVPLRRIYRVPGTRTRRHLVELLDALRERFPAGSSAAAAVVPDVSPPPTVADDPEEEDAARADAGLPPSLDRLARSLLPGTRLSAPVRAALTDFLGLGEASLVPPTPWPDAAAVGAAHGLGAEEWEKALGSARERWRKQGELLRLRDAITPILAAQGGVVTARELAGALLAARGSTESGPRRLQHALAVVRAALEAERAGAKPADGTTLRFAEFPLRPDALPLVAASEALAETARRLGASADVLAAQDPLLPPARTLDSLREIPFPPGVVPPGDARLVGMAAAFSAGAAASPRLELYPRGMPALRALRLAAGALAGARELSPDEVRRRVAARYPEAAPLPGRPDLDRILAEADLGLVWHPRADNGRGAFAFALPAEHGLSSASSLLPRLSTASTPPLLGELSPEGTSARVFEKRLRYAEREGAFLLLGAEPSRLRRAEEELLGRFALDRRDLDAILIGALRREAERVRADWDVVLRTDAAGRDGADWRRLLALVDRVLPAVEDELARTTLPGRTPLVIHPGLLARYERIGLLGRLRDRVGRPPHGLHGLWVLLPLVGAVHAPTLDGHAVPVLSASQWAPVPDPWLTNAHRAADSAPAAA